MTNVYDGPFADVQWHSTADYSLGEPELVHLGDEEFATIREVEPSDKTAIRHFYKRFTPDQIATRFGNRVSPETAAYLGTRDSAVTDPRHNWDTVLASSRGEVMGHAGWTLFGINPELEFHELHCSVDKRLKRKGHGKKLAIVAVRASMALGAPGVTASVKPHNTPVLKIMRKLPDIVGVSRDNLIEHVNTDDDGTPTMVRFVLKLPSPDVEE